MYAHDEALLARILAFDIDGRPAALSFERRLAGECNWSVAFARRVVAEYRRFLYLAMTAGHPVSPSDEVDQAWHLHLTYTDSYWRRLCGEVLPRPLHHGPTAGGPAEGAKFHDWYERTLASYRRAFSAEPPRDIWPPAEARFDPRRQFRRVRTADHWLVSKRFVRNAACAAAAIGGQALLAGAAAEAPSGRAVLAVVLITLAALVLLVVGAFVVAGRGYGRGAESRASKSDTSSGGCGSYVSTCSTGACGKHNDPDNTGDHSGDAGADGGSACGASACGGGGGCGGGGCGS